MKPKAPFLHPALALALPLLMACGTSQARPAMAGSGKAIPALAAAPLGAPIEQQFTLFPAAVFLQSAAPKDLPNIVETLRAQHFPELTISDGEPDPGDTLPVMYVRKTTAEDMPAPTFDELEYFGEGLSPEQRKEAAASQHGVALFFVGDRRDVSKNLPRQNAMLLALAQKLGGYPWDSASRQMFSREAYEPRLDAGLSVLNHVSVHSYRDGELIRIVTLGMSKFGLPDVEVNHVAASDASTTALLVNILCSLLIQGARPGEDGSMLLAVDAIRDPKLLPPGEVLEGDAGRATVMLRRTKAQEGDASEELLELFFGEADDSFVHERRHVALDAMFGTRDSVVAVEHEGDMLAASERAKQRLNELKPSFERGLAPGERLLVKAPFKIDDDGNEWMWVEVVRWKGTTIEGILMNEPEHVTGLEAGATVSVQQADLFDYILKHRDGTSEGNETGKLMQQAQ